MMLDPYTLVIVDALLALGLAGALLLARPDTPLSGAVTRTWALSGALVAGGRFLLIARARLDLDWLVIPGNLALVAGHLGAWHAVARLGERTVPPWVIGLVMALAAMLFVALPIDASHFATRNVVWTLLVAGIDAAVIATLVRAGCPLRGMRLLGAAFGLHGVLVLLRAALISTAGVRSPLAPFPGLAWLVVGAMVVSVLASLGLLRALHEAARRDAAREARTDALTGLPNRRAWDGRLAASIAYARRHDRDLALVLIDLDHFKAINTRHGHPAGDATLGRVGDRLRAHVRAEDDAARLGGEEFGVLLQGVGRAAAQRFAHRLLALLRAQPVGPGGQVVTASIGVAALGELPPDALPATLYALADERLRQAKARRDMVV